MTSENMFKILNLLKQIDIVAAKLYTKMARNSQNNEIEEFWKKMAEEERSHVEFWQCAINYSEVNTMPDIFNEPQDVISDLLISYKKSNQLLATIYDNNQSIAHFFITAYWMEFYLIHPAFESIFHYMKVFCIAVNPEKDYEHHILEFVKAFEKYGNVSLEMELLGSILHNLWIRNRELAKQNIHDNLTNILNRKGILDLALSFSALAKRNEYTNGLIIIDVDDFKSINDTYGHPFGDVVLRKIADRIKSNIRKSDLAGRYGGEEFLVYVNNIDMPSLEKLAEKIRVAIAEKAIDDLHVTVSLGCATEEYLIENEKIRLEKAIKLADDMMYIAKKQGKNRVIIP